MTYLGQPVFPFRPNWAQAVARQITYDLRETTLGFGAAYFTPLADHTVNAWDFPLLLNGAAAVLDFAALHAALVGRLHGF